MTERVELLDHGYARVIEHWGSDERIVETARMSTGKGFLGWGPREDQHSCERGGATASSPSDQCAACHQGPGDEKLLRYLYENAHCSPFEFAGMVVEVQAPIMVFREWHRHRTQAYSEMSARYTPLPDVSYSPTAERCMVVNAANKQAAKMKGAEELTHKSALEWLEELAGVYEHIECVYQSGLRRGIPKELARLPMGVGRYSRMRAITSVRNWMGFMTLRSAPTAMEEIRVYSNAVGTMLTEAFPRTMALFNEKRP